MLELGINKAVLQANVRGATLGQMQSLSGSLSGQIT